MSKIKKFFMTILSTAALLVLKVENVFGIDRPPIEEAYGVRQPLKEDSIEVLKIVLWILVPVIIVTAIVVGIIIYAKSNKKKQQDVNINQNTTNNDNGNV